jgi:hypothetical protein
MRFMTDVVVDVQALTPAPVFRALSGSAAACRPVSGQECSGFAAPASQVESVSGAVLARAAGLLGLVALGEGLLARHGYAAQRGQERPRPVSLQVLVRSQERFLGAEQVRIDGGGVSGGTGTGTGNTNGSNGINGTTSSSKGDNGTEPMSPWDFRTSSPPG